MSDYDRGANRTRLLVAGATRVKAEYSGSGDDGFIDDVQAKTDAGKQIDVPPHVKENVENMLYALLEEQFGGWENEDGSAGEIVWNLKNDTVKIDHTRYYTSSEDDVWEEEGWAGEDASVPAGPDIVIPDFVKFGSDGVGK